VGSTLKVDEILQASPDTFRGELKRMSREDEPARWAAEHLKLGAALRVQARKQAGARRLRTLQQSIVAFEEALRFYCRLRHAHGEMRHAPSSDAAPNPPTRGSNDDGVDLMLSAIRQPILSDTTAIEEAVSIFDEESSDHSRQTAFRDWLVRRLNRGCALTLLGKVHSAQGDASCLERAVVACQELLAEPILRDLPRECALVYINLAEALRSLGDISGTEDRGRFFESAVDSLAMALRQAAPQIYSPLVEPRPISSN
jgi:hypothetical protein